jgi:hypothetical protein
LRKNQGNQRRGLRGSLVLITKRDARRPQHRGFISLCLVVNAKLPRNLGGFPNWSLFKCKTLPAHSPQMHWESALKVAKIQDAPLLSASGLTVAPNTLCI